MSQAEHEYEITLCYCYERHGCNAIFTHQDLMTLWKKYGIYEYEKTNVNNNNLRCWTKNGTDEMKNQNCSHYGACYTHLRGIEATK